jgi:hypothetical protein
MIKSLGSNYDESITGVLCSCRIDPDLVCRDWMECGLLYSNINRFVTTQVLFN